MWSRHSVVPMAHVIDVSTRPSTTGDQRMGPNGHTARKLTRRLVEARSQGVRASSAGSTSNVALASIRRYSFANSAKASCSFFSKQAAFSSFTATVSTHLRGIALCAVPHSSATAR